MRTVISVDGLTKRYGAMVAVDRVSFQVDQGETYGLLGRNGAGKTTTVECLQGLRQAGIRAAPADQGMGGAAVVRLLLASSPGLDRAVGAVGTHRKAQRAFLGAVRRASANACSSPWPW
jgi:energy-coupling factor transporter ATP-binding protein EcfA2